MTDKIYICRICRKTVVEKIDGTWKHDKFEKMYKHDAIPMVARQIHRKCPECKSFNVYAGIEHDWLLCADCRYSTLPEKKSH